MQAGMGQPGCVLLMDGTPPVFRNTILEQKETKETKGRQDENAWVHGWTLVTPEHWHISSLSSFPSVQFLLA